MPDALRDVLAHLGRNVRRARERSSLTQADLAEMCDVEPNYLQRVEYGVAAPSLRLLTRLAEALETEVWRLCKPTRGRFPVRKPGRPGKRRAGTV